MLNNDKGVTVDKITLRWTDLPLGFKECIPGWLEREGCGWVHDVCPDPTAYRWHDNKALAGMLSELEITDVGIAFRLEHYKHTVAEFQKNFYLSPRAWYSTVNGQQVMFKLFGFDMLLRTDRLNLHSTVQVTLDITQQPADFRKDLARWVRNTGGILLLGKHQHANKGTTDYSNVCAQVVRTKTNNMLSMVEPDTDLTFSFAFTGLAGRKLLAEMKTGRCVTLRQTADQFCLVYTDETTIPSKVIF